MSPVDDDLRERVAVLEAEQRHTIALLEEMKTLGKSTADSVRRIEDKFVQVGAWKMAIIAFLPILGGVIGAKFQTIASFLGFK
jgi:hypothetical protein